MPRIASLSDFVEDELARSPELIGRVHVGTLRALREPLRAGAGRVEATTDGSIERALSAGARPFCDAFVAALRERVHEDLLGAARGERGAATLELLDESSIDADIEISRAMQQIDTTAEWELRELQTFTSALEGRRHVSAESNPLRAPVYAAALWAAVSAVLTQHAQRATLLRVAAAELAGQLKLAWAAACTRLEAQGVEPSEYRTVLISPGAVGAREPRVDPTAGRWLAGLIVEMPVRPGTTVIRAAQVEMLVARLFDTIAGDERLSGACRAVIETLREPVRRLAGRDEALLDSLSHPAWQLLDAIARESEGRDDVDPWHAAFLRQAQAAADALGLAPQPVAAQFREALTQLQAFVAAQLEGRVRAAQAIVARLEQAERRERLVQQHRERLADQLAAHPVGPILRRFVTEDWSQVLAESELRHGQADPAAAALRGATDDLLWSLATPDHPQSRQRLVKLLPRLLLQLREGMASIALPEAAQRQVLDELMTVHTAALHRRPGGEATELTPQEIVQQMRDEAVPQPAAAPGFGDSLIDVPSLDTVPAELMEASGPARAGSAVDTGALVPGATRRLFLHGRWTRAQVLWRSREDHYLLFALDGRGRAQAITRRALERLALAGLVQPIEPRPLLQRSVDTLAQQLATS